MQRIASFIVDHKKVVLLGFILFTIISAALIPLVGINYNLMDYLPLKAPSTLAIEEMSAEYTESIPNARVVVPDVSLIEALEIKRQLENIDSVESVLWLDDVQDIKVPLEQLDQQLVGGYYKDNNALFMVTANLDDTVQTLEDLRMVAGEDGAVAGQIVTLSSVQNSTSSEIFTIMVIMLPLGILLLMLTTRNWFEPLVLLIVIGVAIILNLGTNIFLGEISFLTQSVAAVLQLAVSLDYAIFLLHRFNDNREAGLTLNDAMRQAIAKSSVAIASSAMTTFLGFLVLVFMHFRIGGDLGVVLAKGILFSLVTVIGFLPVIVLYSHKWMDKATHRSFVPSFKGLADFLSRNYRWFLLIAVLSVLSFLGQSKNDFTYAMEEYPEGSIEQIHSDQVNDLFAPESQMVLLVPKGEINKELALAQQLHRVPGITQIISYTEMVGSQIPTQIPPAEQLTPFLSSKYSRLILMNDLSSEGEAEFAAVEEIKRITENLYPEYYLAGELPSTYDMKIFTTQDNRIVNGLAILTIGVVLLLTFRSVMIPLLLLLTIETSIWINLAIPYFTGTKLSYIGYLIVSAVQLGATVDYGILYTQHYLDNRKKYSKIEAARRSIIEAIQPLFPPALILTLAGLILWQISSLQVVSELGQVLGRGAALSLLNVIFFLPALYITFDKWVGKLTWRANFATAAPKGEDNEKTTHLADHPGNGTQSD